MDWGLGGRICGVEGLESLGQFPITLKGSLLLLSRRPVSYFGFRSSALANLREQEP